MDYRSKIYKALISVIVVFAIGSLGYWFLGFYYNDPWSMVDCIYMTVITLTTVGYGEVTDLTGRPLGRIFTMILILGGMGVFFYLVSTFTAFLVEGGLTNILWRRKMEKAINKLDGHIIVCGAGTTGIYVIQELIKTETPFVFIDLDEVRAKDISESSTSDFEICMIIGDATQDNILLAAGIERAKGIIACLSNDKDNLYLTVTAKQLNPKVKIVAKAIESDLVGKLKRVGADEIVSPNMIGGMRMASVMIRPQVVSFLDIMLREKDKTLRVEEYEITPDSPSIGKNIGDTDLRKKLDLMIMAIKDPKSGKYLYNPEPSIILEAGMVLILMGDSKKVALLRNS